MKNYIYIGAGGFLGALSRFLLKQVVIFSYGGSLPINTLIINVTGSFILSFLLFGAADVLELKEEVKLGVATGFLGAYTTFSTLCRESSAMLSRGNYSAFLCYVFISTLLGLLSAALGKLCANRLKAVKIRGEA